MDTFATPLLIILVVVGLGVHGMIKAAKKLSDNASPDVKNKAKEVGFGLLNRWMNGK